MFETRQHVAELSDAARVDALVGVQAEINRLEAVKLAVIADLDTAAVAEARSADQVAVDRGWAREQVACALRLSGGAAEDLIELARELRRLPVTVGLLSSGQFGVRHARLVAETTRALSAAQAARIEQMVLTAPADADRIATATLRRRLARTVIAVDPHRAEHEQQAAMGERRVVITPTTHGMAELWALLPADGARTVAAALNALSQSPAHGRADPPRVAPPGVDRRSRDQRRADALIHLAACALAGTPVHAPSPGRRPHIQITIAASTLATLDEHPADLDGHGPIPAGLARLIAGDSTATWRRLLLDDRGHLIDHGRRAYRPPAALARPIAARDGTCRFPHCNRPAAASETDHITAWAHGGATDADNLHPLCLRHHQLKHNTRWTVARTRDGATTWTSPTGHTYVRAPHAYDIPPDGAPANNDPLADTG
jgi:hypothetical protein